MSSGRTTFAAPRAGHTMRPIRFHGVWEIGGWRLKVYHICAEGDEARPALATEGRRVVEKAVAELKRSPTDHGVGFVGIHDGDGADVVFLGLWTGHNELRHIAYWNHGKDLASFSASPVGASNLCVWDIHLLHLERDAWVRHVLAGTDGPDLEGYLADRASTRA